MSDLVNMHKHSVQVKHKLSEMPPWTIVHVNVSSLHIGQTDLITHLHWFKDFLFSFLHQGSQMELQGFYELMKS